MSWASPQMHCEGQFAKQHFLIFNYHTPTTEEDLGYGARVEALCDKFCPWSFSSECRKLCEFQLAVVCMRTVTP